MSSFGQRTSFGGGFGTSTATSAGQLGSTHTRIELPEPPQDSVSAIAWSMADVSALPKWKANIMQYPDQQRVAVGSWDGSVRIYDVRCPNQDQQPQAMASAMLNIDGPVLDLALDIGSLCFTAGADGAVRMHDITSKQMKELGKHEGPCTNLRYDPDTQTVVSGGVDGYIKAFNGSGTCVHQAQLSGLIRDIDARNGHIAALCSDNSVHILNTQTNQTQHIKEDAIKLTHLQMTQVTIIPAADSVKDKKKQIAGFVVGAVDGRCTVHYINNPSASRFATRLESYSYAAHPTTALRKNPKSDIPLYQIAATDVTHKGILLTAGGDGYIRFWDVGAKMKKSEIEVPNQHSVVAARFDPFGRMLCYASSYDWCDGVAGHNGSIPPRIYLHTLKGIDSKLSL